MVTGSRRPGADRTWRARLVRGDGVDVARLWHVAAAQCHGGGRRWESTMVDVELVDVPSETVARVRHRVPVGELSEKDAKWALLDEVEGTIKERMSV